MTNTRWGSRAVLFLAQIVVLLGTTGAVGAAEGGVKFTAEPATKSAAVDGYFRFKAPPGRKVDGAVSVRNITNSRIDLQLAAVAANTAQKGGVDYGLPTENRGIGEWVDLSRTSLRLGPKESRRIPFTVSIPDSALGGVNLAGIAVWVPEDGSGSQGDPNKGNAFVTVQTRRVIAVQVDVPGGTGAAVGVDGVEAVALPDGPYLEMAFTNTGSTLTAGDGTITIEELGFEQDFTFDTFVPRTSVRYPVKLGGMPMDGSYATSVHLEYEDGSVDWSGEMVIGEALTSELVDRGALEERTPLSAALALVGVLILTAGTFWVLRRRQRSPRMISPPSRPVPLPRLIRPSPPRRGMPPPPPSRAAMRPRIGPPPLPSVR